MESPQAAMKVYVVQANDAVDCVFDSEAEAKAYVAQRKLEDNPSGDGIYRRVYWRYKCYSLNEKGVSR